MARYATPFLKPICVGVERKYSRNHKIAKSNGYLFQKKVMTVTECPYLNSGLYRLGSVQDVVLLQKC